MSSKAQKQRILKLNIKDKKLARLFFCKQLTSKDTLFLNYLYEERQNLHFKYALALSGLTGILINYALFRYNNTPTQFIAVSSIFLVSHFYWTSKITKRFSSLIDPYFQKYGIK